MNKTYCKYCGLELDNGSCTCESYLNSIKYNNAIKKSHKKVEILICDTCHKSIDKDSSYCPYCGIPVKIDGNKKDLKEELSGKKTIDVIDFYRLQDKQNGIKNNYLKESKIKYFIALSLAVLIFVYALFSILVPYIKQRIIDAQIKKELENDVSDDYVYNKTPIDYSYESNSIEETSQQKIDLRDKWIKQGGFFYAFDKDGDPVIDDWLTETDENGNEQKYYFDVDGKLVVDSWIDGEYYVGSDGAMLKNGPTPDGAYVDEDGKVILNDSKVLPVEMETNVYYEFPNSEAETVVASRQRSSNSAELRGADPTKELYIKELIQKRETVTKGDLKCVITYYLPVIAGVKEKEVKYINDGLNEQFEVFKNELINVAKQSIEFPKSITINVVEQKGLNKNRLFIIVQGKIYPRHGLIEKRKYRFVYDRKSKKVMLADITE